MATDITDGGYFHSPIFGGTEVSNMESVTFTELFLFCGLIIDIITLVIVITRKK